MIKQPATIKKNGNSITFQISLAFTKLHYPEMKSGNKYLYYGAEYNEKNKLEAGQSLLLLINDLENNTFDRNDIKKYLHKSKRFEVEEKLKLPTLNELAKGYYKEVLRRDVTPGTIKCYQTIINFLAVCPQNILNLKDIVDYIKSSNRGVSTIKKSFGFVSKAFEWGVHENKLPEEVLKFERLIKYEKDSWLNNKLRTTKRTKPKIHYSSENIFVDEIKIYTEGEIELIIKKAKEVFYKTCRGRHKNVESSVPKIIEFISLTGCRTSEAIALTWGDIDFDKQQILINKSLCNVSRKVKCTKTGKSRIFPFKGYTKLINFFNKIKPDIINKNEIIFKNQLGKYLNITRLCQIWSGYTYRGKEHPGLIKELINEGLLNHHIPLYNLRHSFITNQLRKGVNPHILALWVGHDPATQSKHYNKMDGTEFSPMD
jgi:integrase